MVLVDTNVWIRQYRRQGARETDLLSALVLRNEAAFCAQTWVELLGGFKNELQYRRVEKQLSSFPFLETTRDAVRVAARLMSKYGRVGAGDALIAATAMDQGCPLLTLDRGLHALKREGLEIVDQG